MDYLRFLIVQLRRNARLRREYLYKKSVQNEERERLDRQIRIREALEKGLPISEQDLRAHAEETEFGVDKTISKKRKHEIQIDNEYQNAGIEDPKILLTTAHDPSDRLKRFIKELKFIFPNSQRMNRGSQTLKQIVDACNRNGFTDLIVLHEHRGEPDGLIVSHMPYGPTAYFTIYNTIMRHDTNISTTMSEAYPHLIFHNFKTKLGERVTKLIENIFIFFCR